ncbi:YadA C-terminal domain-containing protein [Fusobacterium sp. SYSU M8D902]|uniref:YadA C-terminal domain-containing protein n=1 Tax=Fusobacterium sp. SYSU M8D902 TaxID=3159562 RepID=UPI0032E4F323
MKKKIIGLSLLVTSNLALATNNAVNNAAIQEQIDKLDNKTTATIKRIDGIVQGNKEINSKQDMAINQNKQDIATMDKTLNNKIDQNKFEQDVKNKAQDEKINSLNQNFSKSTQYDGTISGLEKKVDKLDKKMNKGLSLMAAMTAVDFQHVEEGEMSIGAGIGHYGNAQSVAVGAAYSPTQDLNLNVKLSVTAGDIKSSAVGAGASYKFKLR